jgi:chromosome segregation ATPase
MYLKRLELSGFKSFANKTSLDFSSSGEGEKTITAIVGPNGSGKSNIADSLRWVMGEHSMKNLRGKRAEDIIFAGSGKKAKLGSAEVVLVFDNADKRIPLEFEEVSISRKIFRSGENEYAINKSKVRLQDVIDILAKAGVGKGSYSVINQGMSDAILNAMPAERRMVLEDAAGVKQYQIKKERSLKKLESTKSNLKNIGDLVREIEPHLRMLKRQAEKAQKGQEVLENLKAKQIKLFAFLWHTFQTDRENFSQEKNDLGAKMMNAQREVDKISDELGKEAKNVEVGEVQDSLSSKREELRTQLNNLERELWVTEAKIEIEKEKKAQAAVVKSIPVDLGYVRSQLEKIKERQNELIQKLEAIKSLEELQEIKSIAQALREEVSVLYAEAGQGKVEIKSDLSEAQISAEQAINELSVKKEGLQKEIASVRMAADKITQGITAQIERENVLRKTFFELERSLHTKQIELDSLKDKFNEAKIKLAKVEVREEDLIGEIRDEIKMEPADLQFDGEMIDRENLEKEIARLKLQMEQIGGIDPMVAKEYEETNQRFEFLSQESKDLEKAIESLKEVIKEMDKKIGESFSQAFEQINQEFTKYFRIIFGGGNANLTKAKIKKQKIKADEENEEEMEENNATEMTEETAMVENSTEEKEEFGVDIFACPPGKRISNLSMLSGGERSLTSLALLFAIISFNPPPFAVLDEVEAALDEANSKRFSRIIKELSRQTQFVVISHNRETMRQASVLYGVTMGEDGISKLLSVKLDQVGQDGKILQ